MIFLSWRNYSNSGLTGPNIYIYIYIYISFIIINSTASTDFLDSLSLSLSLSVSLSLSIYPNRPSLLAGFPNYILYLHRDGIDTFLLVIQRHL